MGEMMILSSGAGAGIRRLGLRAVGLGIGLG
jgi:hypothetical protein